MKSTNLWTIRRTFMLLFSAATMSAVSPAQAAYPDLVLSNNPVAYYRLEEVSGSTAFDASSNHFDALYVFDLDTNGVPDFPQLGLPGITTNSILFQVYTDNNSVRHSGYILVPYQPELSPTNSDGQHGAPFSAECWVQANTQPADYSIPLAMFGPYESGAPYVNASGWNFYQSPGPASFWIFNMKNGPFAQASAIPIVLLRWYHLAATFDGSNVVFYVNGAAAVSAGGNTGYLADHAAAGQVGAGDNTGFLRFNGGVDEIAFYTNVLTPAQVLAHYQLGTNSFRAVPTRPGFLEQPASRTNFSGTVATFTATASGTLPLAFQWKRAASPIIGATNSTYSFTCSYPADDGATFSVTVTNSIGSTNSAVATLTVLTNLNILHDPFSVDRSAGGKAAFRVVANGAIPISYQWHKVANDINTVIPGATNDTLWLSNLQLADSASDYFAHVTNPFTSTDSQSATLTVHARAANVPISGYARIVLADDPVAYWRLDEPNASTTAIDAVGSFDGTYGPSPTASAPVFNYQVPGGIPHETNTAVKIAGGAVVSIPYALELNPVTGPWSVEAWVKPASLDPGHFRTPFSSMWNSDGGQHLFGWNIYQHVAGVWTLNAYNGGGGGSFTSDFVHNPINTNTWYHMVLADDLVNLRYYVNNALVVTLSRNGFGFIPNGINGDPAVGGAPTVLGQRSDDAFDPFDGSIDEVAFYNYALSPTQVRNHFLNTTSLGINKVGTNVVLTWGVGTLQSAPLVGGIYTNVPGATSPYTNAVSNSQKYYRVLVQ